MIAVDPQKICLDFSKWNSILSQAGSDPPTTPSGSDHNEEAEDLADHDDAPPKAPSPRKREVSDYGTSELERNAEFWIGVGAAR